jgi:LEA14-like dessication related protein
MAKKSRIPLILDILIILSSVAALAVVGFMVTNLVQVVPSVSIGSLSVKSMFPTLSAEVPISISNPGPFEISGVNLRVSIEAKDNVQLLSGSVGPINLPAGAKDTKATVTFTVNASKIPKDTLERLISSSENLTISAEFYTDMPPLVRASANVKGSFLWEPPVYNLKISEPSITPHNATSLKVDIQVSFDNLSDLIPISGIGSITVLDSKDNRVGSGSVAIDASTKSSFNRTLSMFVGIPTAELSTLLFNDSVLNYRAVAEFESFGVSVFTMEQEFSFNWSAPLHGLQIGQLTFDTWNSTHIKGLSGISFDNENDFISINTQVSVKIVNSSSGLEVGSGSININAPTHSHFSDTVAGFINISALPIDMLLFNDATLNFKVIFNGVYSSIPFQFDKDISVNWGAPLKNFAVGTLSISDFSESAIHSSIPVSFENHASWINIAAPLTLKVYNATSNALMGTNTFQITAPALSTHVQTFPVNLEIPSGALDSLMFYDSVQNFKMAFSGSFSGFTFNTIKTYSYNWGAPIKNAQLGSPTIQAYNLTHAKVLVPINFTDNSDFFTISGTLSSTILDANNNVVGTGESVTLSVAHNVFFSTNLITYIDANYVNYGEDLLLENLTLKLTFNTSYGTVQRRLIINA